VFIQAPPMGEGARTWGLCPPRQVEQPENGVSICVSAAGAPMNFLSRQAARASLPPHVQEELDRVTELVEKCTSEILLTVDWAVNMEVVDATNRASSQDVRREIVRQVRKRLQHR
jgi:hypothetical protein